MCEESSGAEGWARGLSASWWGNGLPRHRRVAGLRGRSATLGLRHGPDSYGRQQQGILRNGRKPDAATPRGGRRPSGCKPLSGGKKMTVPPEEAPANYVPAAAVIRRVRALSGLIGRKELVGGSTSRLRKSGAPPRTCSRDCRDLRPVEGNGLPRVAAECADIGRNTSSEGGSLGRH